MQSKVRRTVALFPRILMPSTCPNSGPVAVTHGVLWAWVSGVQAVSGRAVGGTSKLATRVRFSSPAPHPKGPGHQRRETSELGLSSATHQPGRVLLAGRDKDPGSAVLVIRPVLSCDNIVEPVRDLPSSCIGRVLVDHEPRWPGFGSY